MTERERWVVYPLLLLSLGIALRDKITQSVNLHEVSCDVLRCDRIAGKEVGTPCQSLLCEHIVAADAQAQNVIAAHFGGGDIKVQKVEVVGPDAKVRLVLSAEDVKAGGGGVVAVLGADAKPAVLLRALPGRGLIEVVTTVDPQTKLVRALGVGIDQTQQVRQAETPTGQTSEQPETEQPGDEPGEVTPNDNSNKDMPAGEKPEGEKPAGDDKPADESAEL